MRMELGPVILGRNILPVIECSMKVGPLIKIAVGVAALIGVFWLGVAWEGSRCYDGYVYWFCRYSAHLRDLAERQQMTALTNAIVLFDEGFRPYQDAEALRTVMSRMLNEGSFYDRRTNGMQKHADKWEPPNGK
jgi:hypothetical protein